MHSKGGRTRHKIGVGAGVDIVVATRCVYPGLVYTHTDKIGVGPGGDIGGTDISCNLYGHAVHEAGRTKLSGRVPNCSAHQSGVFIEGVARITPICRWSS
jgi:hypothetical protein